MLNRMTTKSPVPRYRAHVSGRVSPVARPTVAFFRGLAWVLPLSLALWASLVWALQRLVG